MHRLPHVEVFADVCCPFAHVGLHRFATQRDAAGSPSRLWVRACPLELVNGEPLDPEFIAEEVAALRAQVAPDLFEAFDPRAFPATSLPAMALAAGAYAIDDDLGERLSLDLRRALFDEGRDVADRAVLAELAADRGLDLDATSRSQAVMADWHEGKRRGVVGSPHFFAGGESHFCPSLDIARIDGHMRIARKTGELEAFLARCLGVRAAG